LDIIQLLPDSVANQIAAGEVIQRPASAVKELLENAVDAGSTHIQLIIKDSGKTLIQIIDNGCGMSETDARMSFERHATSKIRRADDLFCIRTFGFRGEALPSIAAIAQVEMKSKRHDDDVGTSVMIEGADVKSQDAASTPAGTSILVKNLFFNVPARRNFLKSNTVEARHIIDEFQRVALAQPQVALSLHQNGMEVFQLPVSNLRQRIVNIFGSNYNERLVPVNEESSLLNITGFIGKPQFARKTRGEQFLFVNRRFIKDAYLNHAIAGAFEELLSHDAYPSYWLFIDIDPAKVDVNIHPTKTEIKFEDERAVYAIVRAAVKHALGQYSVSPAIDFQQERTFDIPHSMRNETPKQPFIMVDTQYNPFTRDNQTSKKELGRMYEGIREDAATLIEHLPSAQPFPTLEPAWNEELKKETDEFIFQLHVRYIITQVKNGMALIDQQAAHERILYERYQKQLDTLPGASQQSLFPQVIELTAGDFVLLNELTAELKNLGFDLQPFGAHAFVIHGAPVDIAEGEEKKTIEKIIELFKNNQQQQLKLDKKENLIRSFARSRSIKAGKRLDKKEMKQLIDELFACEKPFLSIDGKNAVAMLTMEEIRSLFKGMSYKL
jgi:DNA mismatch repair protein MutL